MGIDFVCHTRASGIPMSTRKANPIPSTQIISVQTACANVLSSSRLMERFIASRDTHCRQNHVAWRQTRVYARLLALLLSWICCSEKFGRNSGEFWARAYTPRLLRITRVRWPGRKLSTPVPVSKAKPPIMAKWLWIIVQECFLVVPTTLYIWSLSSSLPGELLLNLSTLRVNFITLSRKDDSFGWLKACLIKRHRARASLRCSNTVHATWIRHISEFGISIGEYPTISGAMSPINNHSSFRHLCVCARLCSGKLRWTAVQTQSTMVVKQERKEIVRATKRRFGTPIASLGMVDWSKGAEHSG